MSNYTNRPIDGAGLVIINDVFNARLENKANLSSLGTLAEKSTVEKNDLSQELINSINKAETALQSYTESDPTVPAWAKSSTKPVYTATEVGAIPLNMADSFAKKSDISGVYRYKGSVPNESLLPTENLQPGDTYNLEDSNMNVAWTEDGTWDPLGGIYQLDYLTEAEIKTILGVS